MSKNDNLMPSTLDRQISTIDQDAFGHRHFAEALRSMTESEVHTPPFSIGLLGGWGTGKSSIKDLYITSRQNDAIKNDSGHTRSDRFHSITFNAWRFGGKEQDIKRALLRHVFLELGGDEDNLHDQLFRQIQETKEVKKGFVEYTKDILLAWAMPIPAFILSLALLAALLSLMLWLLPVEGDMSKALIILGFTGAYTYLFKLIKPPSITAYRPITRIALPSTTAEQYEELFLKQITKFKSGKSKGLDGKKGSTCERLIVFVDDLDRLSAEEMVLGLDAVRTFMEIPESRLPKNLGLVFVISCDEAKVAHALSERRRQGDMPATVFSQSDARRYLDRIFQFRLEIPPFPRQDMRQFAIKKLTELSNIKAELQVQNVSVENIIDRMIHVDVQDPRNALQIVNAFTQAWWLAKKRETEELGTEKTGGLHEGAVTAHPISLGALSAIKVNYPDFYRDLQQYPALLQNLTDVTIRLKPLEDLPLSAQQLIADRYLDREADDSTGKPLVRPEHRPLRQFLASLIGLRWPDSLQSLLILSEDPVSRKFGSKAYEIYTALVSGDTQGVVEGLGRHTDTSPLTMEETSLLYQMTEELRDDSSSRRINGSRVIADLVNRIPSNKLHLLLGSVCRELGHSADFRSQLGISKIQSLLTFARDDDRKAVASRLIDDVLTTKEDIRFRLETLERPNLEESVNFAQATVALVLPIRRDNGLDSTSDYTLLEWLVNRTVGINGKEHQIPFNEFENWMDEHEVHIIPSLASRYTEILATELESEGAVNFDIPLALGRARSVFTALWSAGEDSRQKLWSDLNRYINLESTAATKLAWEVMVEHVTSPKADQISRFLNILIERILDEDEGKQDDWKLEFLNEAAEAILSIVRNRRSDLEESVFDGLSKLSILWSQAEDTGNLATDFAKELQLINEDSAQHVFSNWTGRILNDLPINCISLLAKNFNQFDTALQTELIEELAPIITTDNIDDPTSKRYKKFILDIPTNDRKNDLLKAHLDKILMKIAARHNNPNSYLYRIFPTVVPLLKHVTPSVLGPAIQTLFTQTKGQPHYSWLHRLMADLWPEPLPAMGAYDPEIIFDAGVAFISTITPDSTDSNYMLSSLRNMLARELVPEDKRGSLIDATCKVWAIDPEKAIATIEDGYNNLTPTQASGLISNIDWLNEEQQQALAQAWSLIAGSQELEIRIETTNNILAAGPRGPEVEPDRGIRLWLDAQNNNRADVIRTAIVQTELNDPYRKRLWQQAVSIVEHLGSDFFLDAIPEIIALSSIEETASLLFSNFEIINNTLASADNRAELGQRIMGQFSVATTNTVKSSIADWAKKLSGQVTLKKLDPNVLTDDDMSILENSFGNSSTLKKIKKIREKE